MHPNIKANSFLSALLFMAGISHAIEIAAGAGIPQYRVFDSEKIEQFVDQRDNATYDVLVMRKRIPYTQDSSRIVEFRLFLQSIRFKTAHSKDTLGTTYYSRNDVNNVCPDGWKVVSAIASGSLQFIDDSLFMGSLATSDFLDENEGPLLKYSNNGFFLINQTDTSFIPGFNRVWVADSSSIYPSAYVDEIKLLSQYRLRAFAEHIAQYPMDNTKEYLLPLNCMSSSDNLVEPVFQSAIPFSHDGFIPVNKW